jgi:phosphopantothenoylcysteine decarboxylase/phosphopantothenate--cysteine ligase
LALAKGCLDSGASEVSVLLGPVSETIRANYAQTRGLEIHHYIDAQDYEKTLDALFPNCDVFFSAAAVLDFESIPSEKKLERGVLSQSRKLEMEIREVPDLVAKVGALKKSHQRVIAFAAESGNEKEILERAKLKMRKKHADAMLANPVWPGLGPDADQNRFWILREDHDPVSLGPASKEALSLPILKTLFGSSF